MTTSNSTLSILFFASIATNSTLKMLPYDLNPVNYLSIAGHYTFQKEISDWDRENIFRSSEYDYLNDEKMNIDMIVDFAQKLMVNSKNLDSEFIEIVNTHFWNLI